MRVFIYLSLLTALLFPSSLFAAPVSPTAVTLFPGSALISVTDNVTPAMHNGGKPEITIELPKLADPSSLRLAENSFSILDMQIVQTPSTDSPEVARIKKELNDLKTEQAKVSGQIKTINSRIAFWSQAASTASTAAELKRIDAAMQTQLAALYPQLYPLSTRQNELDIAIKDLTNALNRATGGGTPTVWQVRLTLNDAPAGKIALKYSYVLSGCGWRPSYRLTARPDAGLVEFAYDAAINQSSGMDWNRAQIALATVSRTASLEPPRLPQWVMREREVMLMDTMQERAIMQAAPMKKSFAGGNAAQRPQRTERTAYMEWQLGARTIPAGRTVTLPVTKENWKAAFQYTARPSKDARAYLTAKVTLPTDRQLARGEAMFLADGALLGKRFFTLSGKKATLFFGNDPLVTAKMTMLTKQSGEEGFIGRKRTRSWAWSITCENRRSYPVDLRIEEPEPQAQHKDIKIDIESTPAPKTEDHKLIWTKELAPQSEPFIIRHTVTATAPKSLDVDFGRYR